MFDAYINPYYFDSQGLSGPESCLNQIDAVHAGLLKALEVAHVAETAPEVVLVPLLSRQHHRAHTCNV